MRAAAAKKALVDAGLSKPGEIGAEGPAGHTGMTKEEDSSGDEDHDFSSEEGEGDGEGGSSSDESGQERFAADDESSVTSSEEESGPLARVGDVPLVWYRDEKHDGYDVHGQKVGKPKQDPLQELIAACGGDPSRLRSVWDPITGQFIELSDQDLSVISNVMKNRWPAPTFDPYTPYREWVHWDQNPFGDKDPSKEKFTRQKTAEREERKIRSLMNHMTREAAKEKEKEAPPPPVHLLWDDTEEQILGRRHYIAAPPEDLPGHDLSYNPPEEFLPTAEEAQDLENNFLAVPKKYTCLRHVPWYPRTWHDRMQRCQDLYACPRRKGTRHKIAAQSLLPDLPSPQDLQPFPQRPAMSYIRQNKAVTSVSVHPSGQWVACGSADRHLRVFEVINGRLMFDVDLRAPITSVAWSHGAICLLMATAGKTFCALCPPHCCSEVAFRATETFFGLSFSSADKIASAAELSKILETSISPDADTELAWIQCPPAVRRRGLLACGKTHAPIAAMSVHQKGDYVCLLSPSDSVHRRRIMLANIPKHQTLCPFKGTGKSGPPLQAIFFNSGSLHRLYLLTHSTVKVFSLVDQSLIRTFRIPQRSGQCMDVHANGDHVLVGSLAGGVLWFDMNYGTKPFRHLKSHRAAVEQVQFHSHPGTYPLFAAAAADGAVHVYHGRVFSDLTKDPMIVPLKVLKGHTKTAAHGVHGIAFHPLLPWLISAGADGIMRCWVD